MAKAAQSEELKEAFEKHRAQTEAQVERLVEVFGIIDKKPLGKKCPGHQRYLEEGSEMMKEFKGTAALDAGLIGAAQAVEHYEMSRYGTLTARGLKTLDLTMRQLFWGNLGRGRADR